MHRVSHDLWTTPVVVALAAWLAGGCGPTVEHEEPPELVEERLEPCRTRCSVMLDPECGFNPEERPFHTVDECIEDCADVGGGWHWARQEDGTDACAQEWITATNCLATSTCEDQRRYFTGSPSDPDFPCKAEFAALRRCFYSTPSLEREGD